MFLFSLDFNPDVTVCIESTGIKSSPQGDRPTYHIEVLHQPTGTLYGSDGFGPVLGSTYFESERDEYETMVQCVLDELAWFANDPDEFVSALLDAKPMTFARFNEVRSVVESLESASTLAEMVANVEVDEDGNYPLTAIPLN